MWYWQELLNIHLIPQIVFYNLSPNKTEIIYTKMSKFPWNYNKLWKMMKQKSLEQVWEAECKEC